MGQPTRGARPPSQAAYYVALAGVVTLLVMLCCYFLYFCIKRVKELSSHESLMQGPVSSAKPSTSTYPVQPVARESASAMAKLCTVPPRVFPTAATSPTRLPLADKPQPSSVPVAVETTGTTATTELVTK